ncbi:hypothetical protein [Flavivirga jejuensis]|uniref:Uncharacterized protein n=1 Tax=Flavivirga jejuensis TaxID=870487 RepID=A0ABT8WSS6_9FLAO|nr:hypothetical protein [Flavivirga jejuensis]MDO5976223.1 hypothetical protein [Flavivirga jejuensis]
MNQILKNKYLRRFFWISSTAILICLLLIRFYIFNKPTTESPDWYNFISDVIEGLVATIITTIGIGVMIFYVTPKVDPKDGAEFLHSREFNKYFKSVLKENPNEWYFRGGFGRYLRTAVIPRLHQVATDGTAVTVKAQILNPQNERLCKIHAHLRNTVNNSEKKTDWDDKEVKINLYATIVVCSIYESNNAFLDISIYLIDFFSTDRIDISTNSGILTKDDQKSPGLKFHKDSNHYRAYKGDLTVTEQQASDVVKKLNVKYKIGKVTGDNIKKILKELNFNENFSSADNDRIALLVNDKSIPYE